MKTLISQFNAGSVDAPNVEVVIGVPALHAHLAKETLRKDFEVSVQNIWSTEKNGAFTGELSADMVKDFGLNWVILGSYIDVKLCALC